MVSEYELVLVRLKEKRIQHGYTQEDCGRILHMSQSHYSKAEKGKKRFTYGQMQKLNQTDMDVHYIITGKNEGILEHQPLLRGVKACDYRCFGQLFFTILRYLIEQKGMAQYRPLYENSAAVRYILNNGGRKNLWKLVREYYGYTQADMAQLFKCDLKKYGRLENEKTFPDSENIFLLYDYFRIPPQIVLGDDGGIIRTIGDLLDMLSEEDRQGIVKLWEAKMILFG